MNLRKLVDLMQKYNPSFYALFMQWFFQKAIDEVQELREMGLCHQDIKLTNYLTNASDEEYPIQLYILWNMEILKN